MFFVATLESGRVKPDDAALIKLVLDSIPQIKPNKYSIIVNKVSNMVMSILDNNTKEEIASFYSPPSSRTTLFFNPMNSDLENQCNEWAPPSKELLSFILNAPEINISTSNLPLMQYAQFEAIVQQLQTEINQIREDNNTLREKKAKQDQFHKPIPISDKNRQLNNSKSESEEIAELREKLVEKTIENQKLFEANAQLKLDAAGHEVTVGKFNTILQERNEEIQKLRAENIALRQTTEQLSTTVDKLTLKLQIKNDEIQDTREDIKEFHEELEKNPGSGKQSIRIKLWYAALFQRKLLRFNRNYVVNRSSKPQGTPKVH